MALTNETCPSNSTSRLASPASQDFGFGGAEISARDNVKIASENINGDLTVNHYYGSSDQPQKQVEKVLSWLDPHSSNYFPAHDEARSRRCRNTGKWFFDTRIYIDWATKEIIELRNVECTGIPGAGKTILASGTIEDLRSRYASDPDSTIILYAYFKHDTQSFQKIPNVLASLLRQVVKKKNKISKELQDLYEEYSSTPDRSPAQDKTIEVLQSELKAYRITFIVVDALDEFSTSSYSSSHALVILLERLNARLLITSRHHVDFKPNTFSTLDISARAEDIRLSVEQHVTGNLAKILHRTPGLLNEIVETVVAKARGMFIIAKLLIESIPDLLTATDVRAALESLPTGPRETYLMTMARIWKQDPHIADLGQKTLSWVFLAQRRLTVLELQHAVSFRSGESTWSGEDLISEEVILSSCLGLVVFVKNEDGVLESQFAHFTTKEFLETCWQEYFPDGKKQITEACLSYLTLAVSTIPSNLTERIILMEDREKRENDNEWEQFRTSRFALSMYAATFWGAHAKAIDGMLSLDAYASFLEHPISPYTATDNNDIVCAISMRPDHFWALYFARFGLLEHLQKQAALIQNHDIAPEVPPNYNDLRDNRGWTALHLSARYGHLHVVEFLLESGANVNRLDDHNDSPLHVAVQAGDPGVPIVQLLLDRGAIQVVDQPGYSKRVPISLAVSPFTYNQPSPDIIRLLLQHEIDIYREDWGNNTSLSLAQMSPNPEIKQLFEEYSRTHPPKPRTYKQRFPEGYFDALNWEPQHSLEPEIPTQMAPSITSEQDPNLHNSKSASDPLPSVNAEPPTEVVALNIPSVGQALESELSVQMTPTNISSEQDADYTSNSCPGSFQAMNTEPPTQVALAIPSVRQCALLLLVFLVEYFRRRMGEDERNENKS